MNLIFGAACGTKFETLNNIIFNLLKLTDNKLIRNFIFAFILT